jgi:hypothetical protein
LTDHEPHPRGLTVACIQASLPARTGNGRAFLLMREEVTDLFQQFFIGFEKCCFLSFFKQTQVVIGPFRKHERSACGNFNTPVSLGVAVQLVQKTEIDPGCTQGLGKGQFPFDIDDRRRRR